MQSGAVVHALVGGALIGLSAAIALLGNGRLAGISGLVGDAFVRDGRAFRIAFLGSLIATGVVATVLLPSTIGPPTHGLPMLVLAGLLVGIGTRLSNGCTSGHGVCGISRGSGRSIVAVMTFMVVGAITVALVGAHG